MRLKSTFRSVYDPIPQWETFVKNRPDQLTETLHTISELNPNFDVAEDFMLVVAIHYSVNNLCQYHRDVAGNDSWKIFPYFGDQGDCEDFALTKRALLINAGLPPGSIMPLICKLKTTGEQHFVLVVREKSNDYILDLNPTPVETLEQALKRLDPIALLINGNWCDTQITDEI